MLRLWCAVLTFLSRWWQLESLYRANAKYRPIWEPRYLLFEKSSDLPRIGIAAARAEGFLTPPARPGVGQRRTPTAPGMSEARTRNGGRSPDSSAVPRPTPRQPGNSSRLFEARRRGHAHPAPATSQSSDVHVVRKRCGRFTAPAPDESTPS